MDTHLTLTLENQTAPLPSDSPPGTKEAGPNAALARAEGRAKEAAVNGDEEMTGKLTKARLRVAMEAQARLVMALVRNGALGREDVADLISGLENTFEGERGFDVIVEQVEDRLSPILEEPMPKSIGSVAARLLDQKRRLMEAFGSDAHKVLCDVSGNVE